MKGKQLAILLVLVVVIGGVSYFLQKGNRSSWSETGAGAGGKVVDLPLNDVAGVTVKTGDAELNLVRKNDSWTVAERADYPADFAKVSDLLRKVWDLKTVQDVKVGPSQLPRLDLIEPGKGAAGGTVVDFKDKDGKRLQALLLGKKHLRKSESPMAGPSDEGFPVGRYVMPLDGKTKVSLVSDSLEEVTPKPETWLQRDFIKIENPKAITLEGTTDAQKWKITRESASADWQLADAKGDEKLDTSKVSSLGTLFSFASFVDVLAPDAKPADTGLDKPAVATFETVDGFTYTLKIGKLTGENHPVVVSVAGNFAKERTPGKDEKPEDKTKLDEEFKTKLKGLEEKLANEKKLEGRPYLIAKFTIEGLLKDRSALLAEKKADAPATGATPGAAAPGLPGASGPAPAPAMPKVEAVTPPVAIPPAAETPAPAKPAPAATATPIPAKPSAPAPEKPAEAAAKPSEPKPAEPKPSEPKPSEPKPAEAKPSAEPAKASEAPAPAPKP